MNAEHEYSKVTNLEFLESCKKYFATHNRISEKQARCIIRILGSRQADQFIAQLRGPDPQPKQDTFQMTNLADTFLAENENFKYISCVFAPYTGEKEYTYKTLLDVEENDFVVVQTPSKEYQIVQIRSIIDPMEFDPIHGVRYKWAMQKLDTEHYDSCVEMEKQVNKKLRTAEVRKRQEELKESASIYLKDDERAEVAKLVRL